MAKFFGPKGRTLSLLLLTVPLWACSPPQDIANVQQIVSAARKEDADFMIQPVDNTTLSMVQNWPLAHPASVSGWPSSGQGSFDTVIAPGDVLSLAVFGADQATLLGAPIGLPNLKVSSRGTIFVPYIDEIHVAGMTENAARKMIQTKLTAIVPDVQVQLAHAAGTRNSVEVLAGLPRNGNFPLPTGDTRLTAILSLAGGIPEQTENPQINLQRGGRVYRIAAKSIFEDPSKDIVLRGGDRIFITKDTRYFLSLGATGREAMINFPKDDMTALDAMSVVGGVNQNNADPKGIMILRQYPTSALAANPDRGPSKQKVIFAFNLASADGLFAAGQFRIEDRDLVLVTQSPLVNTRTMIGVFSGLISAARTTQLTVGE
jgi:polysaccharide export outer membrane protein